MSEAQQLLAELEQCDLSGTSAIYVPTPVLKRVVAVLRQVTQPRRDPLDQALNEGTGVYKP